MSFETWAVAAVTIVDAAGSPLLLRTYTSPKEVLNSPAAPLHAHLYVGPEDVIKLHFVLFASLDRCDELREAALAKEAASATRGSSAAPLSPQSGTRSTGNETGHISTAPHRSPGPSVANNLHLTASVAVSGDDSLTPSASRMLSPTTDQRFLGKLLESHRMRSYGLCSATGVRTLLVTVGSDAPADAMVPLCRALYESASAALCNPFRSPVQAYHAQAELLWQSAVNGGNDNGSGSLREGRSLLPGLPGGALEWSWPRASPSCAAALTAEPTLALSRAFNEQMEGLLSSFTVTARSCIVR